MNRAEGEGLVDLAIDHDVIIAGGVEGDIYSVAMAGRCGGHR